MESGGEAPGSVDSVRAGQSRIGEGHQEVVRESPEGAQEQVRHLLVALEHRTVTGQATGILMERFRLSAEEAFGVLVRLSQDQNMKLYDLACRLTQTGHLPGLRSPGPSPAVGGEVRGE